MSGDCGSQDSGCSQLFLAIKMLTGHKFMGKKMHHTSPDAKPTDGDSHGYCICIFEFEHVLCGSAEFGKNALLERIVLYRVPQSWVTGSPVQIIIQITVMVAKARQLVFRETKQ